MNNKFNIYKAPASCTEDSFAVLWDKPEWDRHISL